MFKTLSTLIAGANARAENRVRDAYAIALIDQKRREAIARMENEPEIRHTMRDRRDRQVPRLRGSLHAGQRRIIDLTRGAIQARAVRRDQDVRGGFNATPLQTPAVQEAEEPIARVLGHADPLEQAQIRPKIDGAHGGATTATVPACPKSAI